MSAYSCTHTKHTRQEKAATIFFCWGKSDGLFAFVCHYQHESYAHSASFSVIIIMPYSSAKLKILCSNYVYIFGWAILHKKEAFTSSCCNGGRGTLHPHSHFSFSIYTTLFYE